LITRGLLTIYVIHK